jgi:hypothetical protein
MLLSAALVLAFTVHLTSAFHAASFGISKFNRNLELIKL